MEKGWIKPYYLCNNAHIGRFVNKNNNLCHSPLNVGIYPPEPVFSHGQLYVALSRGVSRATTRILAKPNKELDPTGKSTKNIVYKDVLWWSMVSIILVKLQLLFFCCIYNVSLCSWLYSWHYWPIFVMIMPSQDYISDDATSHAQNLLVPLICTIYSYRSFFVSKNKFDAGLCNKCSIENQRLASILDLLQLKI